MGTLTVSKTNRLFWLGRYLERVYTALDEARTIFDADVDGREADFGKYCHSLGIPNIYRSTADFCERYYFDLDNPNSISASLGYAYDNAIVLRETLTTDTLSYIQMAMNAMDKARHSLSPGVELQWVQDDIMAFRGSCEEKIDDETARNIIKTGASVERVDLYLRLGKPEKLCALEFGRLFNRLYKTQLDHSKEKMDLLVDSLLDSATPARSNAELLCALEGLFPAV